MIITLAMPLLVTQRDRSFIAAGDYQKLYGKFLYNQHPIDMSSKCKDLFANGRNDDEEREELEEKTRDDAGNWQL